MSEKYYCGLDLGSQRIKAGILKARNGSDVELIGAYESKTNALKNAIVCDLPELSECIHNTMRELIKRTGVKIKAVQLGIGGGFIEGREANSIIPLVDRGSKIIGIRDMKKVSHQARLLGIKIDEEILHELPLCYTLDDVNSVINPFGLYGRKLGVHSFLIVAHAIQMHNITKAVHEAGYDVAHILFSSFIASSVALSGHDRQAGCTLIDMGSSMTSVLIFKEGELKLFRKIDLGGDHFTRSIADQLKLPFDLAEELKKSYAFALGSSEHKEEEILVKRENAYRPIKREDIDQAIKPLVQQVVENVHLVLKSSGLDGQLKSGIIMIGGASLLSGLIEKIGEDAKIMTRLGKIHISPASGNTLPWGAGMGPEASSQTKESHSGRSLTMKNLVSTALFSSVVGLAVYGMKNRFHYISSSNGYPYWARYLINKIKELYFEYF